MWSKCWVLISFCYWFVCWCLFWSLKDRDVSAIHVLVSVWEMYSDCLPTESWFYWLFHDVVSGQFTLYKLLGKNWLISDSVVISKKKKKVYSPELCEIKRQHQQIRTFGHIKFRELLTVKNCFVECLYWQECLYCIVIFSEE